MTCLRAIAFSALAGAVSAPATFSAELHHIQITAASPSEAVRWYGRHFDCTAVAGQPDTADCDGVALIFAVQPTMGSSQGTGINHIGFSYADVVSKMAELEAVGVRGSGVRLQRFDDGATLRELPGMFLHGFVFDPWGTRIEVLQDPQNEGFHQVHLSATDPAETLDWYRKTLGGSPAKFKGRENALRFGDVWLFAAQHPDGKPAPTRSRAVAHIAFDVPDLGRAGPEMRRSGADFESEPETPRNARSPAKRAFVRGPDNVRIAIVESGYAGIASKFETAAAQEAAEPYAVPRTPWGEPDMQGVWTGNSAHGIPLERPQDLEDVEALTPEQAAARRERGTLGSIWGYEREWRDTTLGYDKMTPSTQVAMIVDPPNGRLPALTVEGKRMAAEAQAERASKAGQTPDGPEDLNLYHRCITRGLPGLMMPGIYNNGLQIVQGPGFVAIQKEMIHETRAIPTKPRKPVGEKLTSWLGDPQGRWEGDTLVVETGRLNGRAGYRGATAAARLTERFTRVGPTKLRYEFTIDDPTVWVQPWTATFAFDLDDAQYELVEYACHEGNYGMFNALTGARARDKRAAESGK